MYFYTALLQDMDGGGLDGGGRDGLFWNLFDYATYLSDHPTWGLLLLAALGAGIIAGATRSYLLMIVGVVSLIALASLLFVVSLVTSIEPTGAENLMSYVLFPFVLSWILTWWASN